MRHRFRTQDDSKGARDGREERQWRALDAGYGSRCRAPGGDGEDLYTGGNSREFQDFNAGNGSWGGFSLLDVISYFVHGQDKLDLDGIDPTPLMPATRHFTGSAAPPSPPTIRARSA